MDIEAATRPVGPDDRLLLCRMWPRLSWDTVCRRFYAPVHTLPEAPERGRTMSHLRATLARRRTLRAHLREERALAAAMATAPTAESAHEIATLTARR